jgi:23S rRNA (cytidine1920-2'-O)/16S rRNA (cytidine1409-2'-O)-methyltransferase
VWNWLEQDASLVVLIKPQFEAGRKAVARGQGVVRDAATHRSVLQGVLEFALEAGFTVRGLLRSPVLGPKGNVEFLAWLANAPGEAVDINSLIDSVLE